MLDQKHDSIANAIAQLIDEATEKSSARLYGEAWATLQRAERLARAAKITSAFLHWRQAVVADQRDDAGNAVKYIILALKLDPAAPPYINSHEIIGGRVQVTLRDLETSDPRVPVFFRLLVDLDAVDAAALHLYARHMEAQDNLEAALGFATDAIDCQVPNPQHLLNLAHLLDRVGRHAEAGARRREAQVAAQAFPCPEARA